MSNRTTLPPESVGQSTNLNEGGISESGALRSLQVFAYPSHPPPRHPHTTPPPDWSSIVVRMCLRNHLLSMGRRNRLWNPTQPSLIRLCRRWLIRTHQLRQRVLLYHPPLEYPPPSWKEMDASVGSVRRGYHRSFWPLIRTRTSHSPTNNQASSVVCCPRSETMPHRIPYRSHFRRYYRLLLNPLQLQLHF